MSVQLDEKGKVMMDLVPIPAGNFIMGVPRGETPRAYNYFTDALGPLKSGELTYEEWIKMSEGANPTRVRITRPFWLTRTVITQGQWKAFYPGSSLRNIVKSSSKNGEVIPLGCEGDEYPMIFINWDDAKKFCRELTSRAETTNTLPEGYEYRLPTEAEWEYACRAGTTTATYAGPMKLETINDQRPPVLDGIAWYIGNSFEGYTGDGWKATQLIWITHNYTMNDLPISGPHKVATKRPNGWGLFDMLGNVSQWCEDCYAPLPGGPTVLIDPYQTKGIDHVRRGGNWLSTAFDCRSGIRKDGEYNPRPLGVPDSFLKMIGDDNRRYDKWGTDKAIVLPGKREATMGFRVALAPKLKQSGATN